MSVKNFTKHLIISSPAFEEGKPLPEKYTCEGTNISPPLSIKAIPASAKSLVLFLEDPDAPSGTFDHWLVFNISPDTSIDENVSPGTEILNSSGSKGYMGPCPPAGQLHHYVFTVYALNKLLTLTAGANKRDIVKAMEGHILAKGELSCIYKRVKEKIT